MSGPEAYNIWRYAVDGSIKYQLTFDPPPLDSCCASPDGKWFLYSYGYYPGKTSDKIPSGLYLGDLNDGSAQLYVQYSQLFSWNTDSTHFIFEAGREIFLGAINERPEFIDNGRFLGWPDNSRYLYYHLDRRMIFLGEIGETQIPITTSLPAILPLEGHIFFPLFSRIMTL